MVAYENSSKSSLTKKTDFKRQRANRWSVTESDQTRTGLTMGKLILVFEQVAAYET